MKTKLSVKDGKLAGDVLRVIDPVEQKISRKRTISRLQASHAPFAESAAEVLRTLRREKTGFKVRGIRGEVWHSPMPDETRQQIEEAAAAFAVTKIPGVRSWKLLSDGVLDITMKNTEATMERHEGTVERVLNPLGWRLWASTWTGFALKRSW